MGTRAAERVLAPSLPRAAGAGVIGAGVGAGVGVGVGTGVVGAGVLGVGAGVVGTVGMGVGAQPPATCLTPHDVDAHKES